MGYRYNVKIYTSYGKIYVFFQCKKAFHLESL